MNTDLTAATKSTDYVYVKDLPDAGGLRAARMKQHRAMIERYKSSGYRWVIVYQSDMDDRLLYRALLATQVTDGGTTSVVKVDPYFREVYDTTMDLASQFAEKRAVHW